MQKIIAVVVACVTITTHSFALFGAGDVVSDPTSYTYYAKQIKAMNDQIKSALDQLDQLNKVNKAMDEANKLIFESGERIYNPSRQIQNIMRNLTGLQSRFERISGRASELGMERFFKEYHNVDEPLRDEDYIEFRERFKKLFSNNEDETYQKLQQQVYRAIQSGDYSRYEVATANLNNYMRLKGIEREKLRRAALLGPTELYNDYFLNGETVDARKQKQEAVQDLIRQVEEEKDLLKQTQTTNHIMLELLEIAQNQYQMQMQFFNAISLVLMSDKENQNAALDAETIERKKEELGNTSSGKRVEVPQKDIDKWIEEYAKESERIRKQGDSWGGLLWKD